MYERQLSTVQPEQCGFQCLSSKRHIWKKALVSRIQTEISLLKQCFGSTVKWQRADTSSVEVYTEQETEPEGYICLTTARSST